MNTEITADPDLPVIRIRRSFHATPAQVFAAHVDPERVVRWLGPRRLVMTLQRWDATTGGAYRYTHTAPDGGEHRFFGSFHEVRPPSRLVQTFTYEGFPDGVSLDTLTLSDPGDGTTLLEGLSVFTSTAERDAAMASGMESGVVEGYERLDELLAG